MSTKDSNDLAQQLELLERAIQAMTLNKGTTSDFSYGVICTSAAQALGMSFQASALNMQASFMTNQAATIRSVAENFREMRCGCGVRPCCCQDGHRPKSRKKKDERPRPSAEPSDDSGESLAMARELRLAMDDILEGLAEVSKDPRDSTQSGDRRQE